MCFSLNFQGSQVPVQFQPCESSGTSSSSGYASTSGLSGNRYDNVRGLARGPFVSYLEDSPHSAQIHYNHPTETRPTRPKDLAIPRSPLIWFTTTLFSSWWPNFTETFEIFQLHVKIISFDDKNVAQPWKFLDFGH